MAVRYVAGTRLLIDGSYREPGEAVPEAADWPNLRAYLGCGHVLTEEVEDTPAPTLAPTPATPPTPRPATRRGR